MINTLYTRTNAAPPNTAIIMAAPIFNAPNWKAGTTRPAAAPLVADPEEEAAAVLVPAVPPAPSTRDLQSPVDDGVWTFALPLKSQASEAFFCLV